VTARVVLAAALLLTACSAAPPTPSAPTASAPVVVVTQVAGVAASRRPPAAPRQPASGASATAVDPPPARAAPAASTPGPVERLDTAVAARLSSYAGEIGRDRVGVVVENLATGERFVHNGEQPFPSGSVYKLALAWEVMRRIDQGRLRPTDELTIEPADALEAEPEGGVAPGERVTVGEALDAMMRVSSNAAAYVLLRLVGRSELNASLRALGLQRTTVPLLNEPAVPGGEALHPEWAMTTPVDMAGLLRLLATERTLAAGSRAELRRLLAIAEPIDPLRDGSPPGAEVLDKIGSLEDATNAAGLLNTRRGPVVVAVFTTEVPPGRAHELIADLARAVHQLYGA
jgi:beta-lactamase class A